MDDCIVEVVQIRFVMRLKLMEEVEETKSKHSMQSNESGREPSCFEKLSTSRSDVRDALAVSDNNLMDASEIKDGELVRSRVVLAYLADWVTQLHGKTERAKQLGAKVLAVPPLQSDASVRVECRS